METLAPKIAEILDITIAAATEMVPVLANQFMWYQFGRIVAKIGLAFIPLACLFILFVESGEEVKDIIKARKIVTTLFFLSPVIYFIGKFLQVFLSPVVMMIMELK